MKIVFMRNCLAGRWYTSLTLLILNNCKAVLFFLVLLPWFPGPSAVEKGVFHCVPAHSAHYLELGDGEAREVFINNENVIIIITIGKGNIHLQDSRRTERKTIEIVENISDGSVTGRSGTRLFYMDPVLHYFYGAVGEDGNPAYAEDGMCSKY